ncbi:unnamed protein product [Acanthoscelides obtectus]|uniref:Uncharacterized protein n=1 Tax=Acanthoscelides obtectus TaxID=200917 RepID=A0A9P0PTY5_ACAOB|nr:unnamed protein product [Acanthoscelides obtectus]CAK1648560.1 hypothetical protein AOBTE_LOCUS15764 [Acanthoscelides obtectus]
MILGNSVEFLCALRVYRIGRRSITFIIVSKG